MTLRLFETLMRRRTERSMARGMLGNIRNGMPKSKKEPLCHGILLRMVPQLPQAQSQEDRRCFLMLLRMLLQHQPHQRLWLVVPLYLLMAKVAPRLLCLQC